MTQQVFLRQVMQQLNLTREGLSMRLSVSKRALDSWLLPSDSRESRVMPEVVRCFINEILSQVNHMSKYTQSVDASHLGEQIAYQGRPHLLSVEQFNRETVEQFCLVADMMQPIARRQKVCRVLEGAVLANLFFEASTRTRVSFGAAFCRLGGSVCDTTGFAFSSMAKGESIYDTSRVIAGYADAIVVRHPDLGSVAEFAAATHVPVINGGDGPGEHPSQALLDLYTIKREFARLGKEIDGAHIAMVGDLKYGRTVHSLIKLLSLYHNMHITLISPSSLEMPQYVLDKVSDRGHRIVQTQDLQQGLQGADVVYATRIQKERFANEGLEGYTPDFQINAQIVSQACKADTIIMHPLPRDSREGAHDLATDLNGDERLAIFRQTDNGIPVRMAIFAVLLGVDHLVPHYLQEVPWRSPARFGIDDAHFV